MAVTMYKKTRERLQQIWDDGMENEEYPTLFDSFALKLEDALNEAYNTTEITEQVLLEFLDCETDEEFNAALGMFEAIVGRKLTAFTGTVWKRKEDSHEKENPRTNS